MPLAGAIAAVLPTANAEDAIVVQTRAGKGHTNSGLRSGSSSSSSSVGVGFDFHPDNSTLFEVGSVTKVLTAIAAKALCGNEAAGAAGAGPPLTMDATIGDIAGAAIADKFAYSGVGTISLRELGSHTSGLLKLPTNLHGTHENPFSYYTDDDLWGYLGNLTALPTRGAFLYSNLGFGLLGRLLELHTGETYEALLQRLILAPLQMHDTTVTVAATNWSKVAPGVSADGSFPTWRNTTYGVLQGQGSVHSSVTDMTKFLAMQLKLVARTRQQGAGSRRQDDHPVPPSRGTAEAAARETLARAMLEVMVPTAPNDFPAGQTPPSQPTDNLLEDTAGLLRPPTHPPTPLKF